MGIKAGDMQKVQTLIPDGCKGCGKQAGQHCGVDMHEGSGLDSASEDREEEKQKELESAQSDSASSSGSVDICPVCVAKFDKAGGCDAMKAGDMQKVQTLIPDGCKGCGKQAGQHCGVDMHEGSGLDSASEGREEEKQKELESACVCTKEYAPVCGMNEQTFGNKCMAKCKGQKVKHAGRCSKEEKKRGDEKAEQVKEEKKEEAKKVEQEEATEPPKPGPIDKFGGEVRLQSASVSSVSEGYSAGTLVNGQGLDSNGLHSPLFQQMWLSARGKVKGEKVTLHLHKPTNVSKLKIWNYDGPSSATRGVMELSIINDEDNSVVRKVQLNRANSAMSVEAAQIFELETPVVFRSSISLRVESNYGGHYAGLAHVSVYGKPVKEEEREKEVEEEEKGKQAPGTNGDMRPKEEEEKGKQAKKPELSRPIKPVPSTPEAEEERKEDAEAAEELKEVEEEVEKKNAPNCRCPDTVKEVCGVDGNTYVNACSAGCKQVAIAYEGTCKAKSLRGSL